MNALQGTGDCSSTDDSGASGDELGVTGSEAALDESRDHPLDASRVLLDSGEPEITDELIDQISRKPVNNYDYGQLPTEVSKGKKLLHNSFLC